LPGPSTWRSSISSPQALRSGNRAIALVAEESGYESESAFNRAFKRIRHAARSLAPAADLTSFHLLAVRFFAALVSEASG